MSERLFVILVMSFSINVFIKIVLIFCIYTIYINIDLLVGVLLPGEGQEIKVVIDMNASTAYDVLKDKNKVSWICDITVRYITVWNFNNIISY